MLLAQLVYHEARGEDLKGQILVANVVLNRVASTLRDFADVNTIEAVIFQQNQFIPAARADFRDTMPTERNKRAVNMALSGTDYSQGALWFDSSVDSWASRNREFVMAHGGHRFWR